jgi:dUTPase
MTFTSWAGRRTEVRRDKRPNVAAPAVTRALSEVCARVVGIDGFDGFDAFAGEGGARGELVEVLAGALTELPVDVTAAAVRPRSGTAIVAGG